MSAVVASKQSIVRVVWDDRQERRTLAEIDEVNWNHTHLG